MSSNRISRGFHRLAIFLVAIPLLVGSVWSVTIARDEADRAQRYHAEALDLLCAKERLAAMPKSGQPNVFDQFDEHDLKDLGCTGTSRKVSVREISAAAPSASFSYVSALLSPLAFVLGVALIVSLAVYALVRAIGWVIGGFARA